MNISNSVVILLERTMKMLKFGICQKVLIEISIPEPVGLQTFYFTQAKKWLKRSLPQFLT